MENYIDILLSNLRESPTNPRKHYSESSIQELALNIKAIGIIEPLVVRPIMDGDDILFYEIICGSRRFRASTVASIETVPCVIRYLTDDQVFDIQISENLQREDVSPLDECDAYQTLMSKKHMSMQDIAYKFGKSDEYIFSRLRLINLIKEGRDYLENGIIPITAAIKIASLNQDQQNEAIKRTIIPVNVDGQDKPLFSGLRDLKHFLDTNVTVPLKFADFDTNDANLCPMAGSCGNCPKRTGHGLFQDLVDSDKCLDSNCYNEKHIAHYKALERSLIFEKKGDVIFAARQYNDEKNFESLGRVLKINEYSIVEKKTKTSVYAVMVGPDRSRGHISHTYIAHAWVEITKKVTAILSKEEVKKEKQKELVKKEKEVSLERFVITSLFNQFKTIFGKKKPVLTNEAIVYLSTRFFKDLQTPDNVMMDIITRYHLAIKAQVFDGKKSEDELIDSTFKMKPNMVIRYEEKSFFHQIFSLNRNEIERLLSELVFLHHAASDDFTSTLFKEGIDVKKAKKEANELYKEHTKK